MSKEKVVNLVSDGNSALDLDSVEGLYNLHKAAIKIENIGMVGQWVKGKGQNLLENTTKYLKLQNPEKSIDDQTWTKHAQALIDIMEKGVGADEIGAVFDAFKNGYNYSDIDGQIKENSQIAAINDPEKKQDVRNDSFGVISADGDGGTWDLSQVSDKDLATLREVSNPNVVCHEYIRGNEIGLLEGEGFSSDWYCKEIKKPRKMP